MNIRNFSIIAHIDHGKSTLADRMLEITNTVPERKMKDQVLDSMELERERGITIKMTPVRMTYDAKHNRISNDQPAYRTGRFPISNKFKKTNSDSALELGNLDLEISNSTYTLNLIDTPGHIDFSYEVSRALKAVEGVILLVDSTQGVQAQTLSVLAMAQEIGLVILPVISKIDSPAARISDVKKELATLLGCDESTILEVSGKTGQGVENLLDEVVKRIPPPKDIDSNASLRSLVFDFQYDNHRGVIVYVRVVSGSVKKGDTLLFKASKKQFNALEVGFFFPDETPVEKLSAGEIGYIVTGIKEPGVASVGDTVAGAKDNAPALSGYLNPKPVVWASVYPEDQDHFDELRQALGRMRLSDSSLSYEEESSGVLGRGFRCGFLGMLHLEIVTERLRREFNLELVVTTPSITYEVTKRDGKKVVVYSPLFFPEDGLIESIKEPWVDAKIITPEEFIGPLMQLFYNHEAEVGETENFGNRTTLHAKIPLRELMRGFFDEVKSASSGFASISYEMSGMREADVVKLDILVADESVPAFARVVSRRKVQEEAEKAVEKLYGLLPRQMFTTKIQGKAMGRILSSKTITALKKNVTGHLYGGDITRKRKLWEKQKKGKKKMKERGTVNIPSDVFMKMMRSSDNK